MKKFGLFSVLVLGLVLVAGCVNQRHNMSSDDIMSIWEKNHEMTCDMTYEGDDGEGKATMYVKDDMLKQELVMKSADGKMEMMTLLKDGKMYMWDETDRTQGISMEHDANIGDEIKAMSDGAPGVSISCKNGVKNSHVFDLPTDIDFPDESELGDFSGGDIIEENMEENMEDNGMTQG